MSSVSLRSALLGLLTGSALAILAVGAEAAWARAAVRPHPLGSDRLPLTQATRPKEDRAGIAAGSHGERHDWLHERMAALMDRMMGEGAHEEMHAIMPGSEEQMERMTARMLESMDREEIEAMLREMEEMMAGKDMGGMMDMMRSPASRMMMRMMMGGGMMGPGGMMGGG